MKIRILFYSLVFLLFVFAGNVLAGSEGTVNTFYGNGAGHSTTGGTGNETFIGANAGYNNTGLYNTFVGYYAGYYNTGGYNTFIGLDAGETNNTGQNNTFIGAGAGDANQSGNENTFLGHWAGYKNTTAHENTFLGGAAGYSTTIGQYNVMVGYSAGIGNVSGSNSTYIGYDAGEQNSTGSGNVFIGYGAGKLETGSNTLYIANSGTTTPLIYGNFDTNILAIPGSLGIGTKAPVRQLHLVGSNATFRMDRTQDTAAFLMVRTDASGNPMKTFVVGTNSSGSGVGTFVINDLGTAISGGGTNRMTINNDGSVTFTGNVYANSFTPSSLAYKDNVRTYENALETINKLRGVKFDWKDSGKPSVGLIAEEVEKVVPEVVAHNDGNATGVNYASLVGVLVEAVKEQQGTIQKQEGFIQEQQKINAELRTELNELKVLLLRVSQ